MVTGGVSLVEEGTGETNRHGGNRLGAPALSSRDIYLAFLVLGHVGGAS